MSDRFERRERRYRMRDTRALERNLDKRADRAAYRVTTLYLDRLKPTWSADDAKPGAVKLRLRQYGQDAPWYLESKVCRHGRVSKRRKPVGRMPTSLRLIMSVNYRRHAWELPGGVRVTIDDQLTCQHGRLPGRVVEVKGELPDWLRKLLPAEAHGFSKSAWALGRWHGR